MHTLYSASRYLRPRRHGLTIILTLIALLSVICASPAVAQANLTVSRDAINFGYKVITEPVGKSHLVTLKNTGNQNLSFNNPAFQITGAHASDFTITTAPATTSMSPNTERYMHIAFTPATLGEKQADLVIRSFDPDTPVTTVALTGQAVPARAITGRGIFTSRPFDGYGPGKSTIGTGGDYPSLYEATEAISATPLTGGDWDFVILNDLHEPNHCTIQHENNNGHTITFRPAPDTSPRVTFTTTVQTGQAHITLNEPTSHITFDGTPTPDATSITLTFANVAPAGSTLIQGLRNCDYITVRNCRFEQESFLYAIPRQSAFRSSQIINFRPRHYATPSPDKMADYITIRNCDFVSTVPVLCEAILINDLIAEEPGKPLTNSSPNYSTGVQIKNNNFRTFGTAVSLPHATESNVEANRIYINPDIIPNTQDFPRSGIHLGSNSTSTGPFSVSINRNIIHFKNFDLDAYETNGISILSRNSNGFFSITNNSITGLRMGYYQNHIAGIRSILLGYQTNSAALLAHNSMYFRKQPTLSHAGVTNTVAISEVNSRYFNSGTTIMANNIIHMGNTTGTAIVKAVNLISNHNNIITSPSGRVGQIGSTVYTTLADWQTSTGHDLASISQDPFVPAGDGLGTWVGPADAETPDLHFTSFPGEMYLAPPLNEATHLTTVPTDIDGEPRNPIATLMGADEIVPEQSAIKVWEDYQVLN